jgi:hypothetical protein
MILILGVGHGILMMLMMMMMMTTMMITATTTTMTMMATHLAGAEDPAPGSQACEHYGDPGREPRERDSQDRGLWLGAQ